MKNTNSTVILLYRSQFFNYNLTKGFVILEHNSKHLISVLKEVKQIIHAVNKHKTDYGMACYTAL